MDPALLKEKKAFKKRAFEAAEKSEAIRQAASKASQDAGPSSQSQPPKHSKKKKKRKSLLPPKPFPSDGSSSMRPSPYQSNNPLRVLKAVVDMMKERYTNEDYEPLNLDQLLARIDRTDLSSELQQGLVQALKNNEKVEYYPEGECFLFKPALGLHVRTRKQLLQRLKVNDEEGLGGLLMSEIREAVHSPDRVMKKLDTAGEVLRIVRQDKEEVIFYNNHDVELETPISEEFKAHWHRVSIDGMTDEDIEKYLQNVGLGAMGGEGRKRKAPGEKKAKKRSRTTKILNVHLDESVLKDYSGDKDS